MDQVSLKANLREGKGKEATEEGETAEAAEKA